MKLSDLAKRILTESTGGASKWAIQIDDANSSMTAEEYATLLPTIGITILKQKGEPDTLASERGRSSYYTYIVSATEQAIDNFYKKYPEGVDIISPEDLKENGLEEDTWGNNPAAAGSMSPGKTPNAVSPAPVPNEKLYDVGKDFHNFETTIEREEEGASKNLENSIKQQLGNKKVLARAGKGSVGQTEKDYEINVVSVEVTYQGDKHYVILKDNDGKDYYINTNFKVKILGPAEAKGAKKETPPSTPPSNISATGKKNVGGIVAPQNMGLSRNQPA